MPEPTPDEPMRRATLERTYAALEVAGRLGR